MYSILCSKIETLPNYKKYFSKILHNNQKVIIIPWSFAKELNNLDEFFSKNDKRYKKYVSSVIKIGLSEKNMEVLDCYKDSKELIKEKIRNADVLVLTGGNPEMFYSKVVQYTECLYDIKHFKGIIIGSSAGADLQLTRYFITAKNNYYNYFSFYDGFGILNDPFYIDVHTSNNKYYLNKLQKISNEKQKNVYAIYDNGLIIYNRKNCNIEVLENVKLFSPQENNI